MLPLVHIAGGLALLYFGAEGLVRGSAVLALRMGVRPLVIGLTVVAFGTSSPELVVSIQAALGGNGDIAIGNVVGSNICNVALILGLSAVIRPIRVHTQLLRQDVPLVILCSVLLLLMLIDGALSRLEGLVLTAGIVSYILFNLRQVRRKNVSVDQSSLEEITGPVGSPWRDVLFIAGGLGLLTLGADLLVDGAVATAEVLGLGKAFVGLTIVAIGTSLPELATSLVAATRNEGDLAVGNVIGSNVFNILGILGLSSLVRPLQSEGVELLDLGVMILIVLLSLPLLRTGLRLVRWEGALLFVIYLGYLAYLLP